MFACPCFAVHTCPHRFPGSVTALLNGWGVFKAALSARLDENLYSRMCQALGRSDTPNFAVNTPSVTEEVSCVAHSPSSLTFTPAVIVLCSTLHHCGVESVGCLSFLQLLVDEQLLSLVPQEPCRR